MILTSKETLTRAAKIGELAKSEDFRHAQYKFYTLFGVKQFFPATNKNLSGTMPKHVHV